MTSLASVFGEIFRRYDELGIKVVGGYSPSVAPNSRNVGANFNRQGNTILSSSGSVSDDEISFMYGLSELFEFKNILVIGNSYGLSTLAVALMNPLANVVALDKYRTKGIEVTKRLSSDLENVRVIQGSTPEDLEQIARDYFSGGLDFVIVDAVHENEVMLREFEILAPFLDVSAAVCFHDVLSTDLLESFNGLSEKFTDFQWSLLPKTNSGLGLAWRTPYSSDNFSRYLAYFQATPESVTELENLLAARWQSPAPSWFSEEALPLHFPPHPQI